MEQKTKHYAFFQHQDCEFFPCHEGIERSDFNCLFCYCPLYALGERCGGNYRYLESGVKSCEHCNIPHRRENYERILSRFPDLARLAGRAQDKE